MPSQCNKNTRFPTRDRLKCSFYDIYRQHRVPIRIFFSIQYFIKHSFSRVVLFSVIVQCVPCCAVNLFEQVYYSRYLHAVLCSRYAEGQGETGNASDVPTDIERAIFKTRKQPFSRLVVNNIVINTHVMFDILQRKRIDIEFIDSTGIPHAHRLIYCGQYYSKINCTNEINVYDFMRLS